jgi:hypothetical protein
MAPNPSKYCTLSGNEHVGTNYCSECGAPPATNTTSDLPTSTNTQLNDVLYRLHQFFHLDTPLLRQDGLKPLFRAALIRGRFHFPT